MISMTWRKPRANKSRRRSSSRATGRREAEHVGRAARRDRVERCRAAEERNRYPVCLLGEGVRDNGVELADERAGTGSVKRRSASTPASGSPWVSSNTSSSRPPPLPPSAFDVLHGKLQSRQPLSARPGDPRRGQRAHPAEHNGSAATHPAWGGSCVAGAAHPQAPSPRRVMSPLRSGAYLPEPAS
jgi:hypothetical protein